MEAVRTNRWLLAPLLLLLSIQVQAQVESDTLLESLKPQGYVSDYAGVMNANLRRSLEGRLRELEQKTSAQIAVVTLRSLKGGEIRDFANRLSERWGVGRKGKDNGVLILTSLEDRKIWVEVGYGLEGILPDARVGRILDQAVLPEFRHGRHGGGLARGALTIAGVIAENSGATLGGAVVPPDSRRSRRPGAGNLLYLLFLLFLFLRRPLLGMFLPLGMGAGFPRGGYGGGFSGGGFGGFGGGLSGGGGAGRSW